MPARIAYEVNAAVWIWLESTQRNLFIFLWNMEMLKIIHYEAYSCQKLLLKQF